MPGGYGVMGDDGSMDYSVHEAWNEATNVYLEQKENYEDIQRATYSRNFIRAQLL